MDRSPAVEKATGATATARRRARRKAHLALLLSVCPGLGQMYAGHLVRGVLAYAGVIVVSWLAAIAYMDVTGRVVSFLLLAVPCLAAGAVALDAVRCARRQPRAYALKWYNRAWVYGAVFAALLLTVNPLMDLLVGSHVVRAFFVTSDSMAPGVLRHDLVVINKLAAPERGDILLLELGGKPARGAVSSVIRRQTLRRIVAVAGDEVAIQGRSVVVNGVALEEPYARHGEARRLDPFSAPDYRWGPSRVPPDAYFVLADARQFGFDSRTFGFVRKDDVSGVARKVFWSWNLDEGHFKWERTAMSLR